MRSPGSTVPSLVHDVHEIITVVVCPAVFVVVILTLAKVTPNYPPLPTKNLSHDAEVAAESYPEAEFELVSLNNFEVFHPGSRTKSSEAVSMIHI